MDINYKVSFKIFGSILCVLSASMLLPLIVGLIYKDYASSLAFAYTLVPSSILGLLLIKLTSVKSNKLKMRDGAFIVSVSWILCGLIGAIPFVITGSIPNFISAFFETCSGFSTTGATVIPDVEIIPKAVLFWRSFTHWLGGMGILVFTIALLPAIGVDGQQVAAAEVPGLSLSKIVPKLSDTARYLYLLYTALTLVETGLLMFGGMTFFDAICHSFSTLGTGGFGNYNDSIAHFNSLYIDIIITLFMMIAGMNFNLFFIAYRNGISTFFKDAEWRFYILIIGFTSILMSIILYVSGTYNSIISSIRYVLFQNVSILIVVHLVFYRRVFVFHKWWTEGYQNISNLEDDKEVYNGQTSSHRNRSNTRQQSDIIRRNFIQYRKLLLRLFGSRYVRRIYRLL